MKDIRPGTAGRASHQPPHLQYARYRAAQSRAHAGAAQVLKQRSKPPSVGPVKLVQHALETIGLSGAAHPIRRLQHPGGRMEFVGGPGAAESGLGRALGRQAEAATTLRETAPELSQAEWEANFLADLRRGRANAEHRQPAVRAAHPARKAAKVAGVTAAVPPAFVLTMYAQDKIHPDPVRGPVFGKYPWRYRDGQLIWRHWGNDVQWQREHKKRP
jgi:hypothetical protein